MAPNQNEQGQFNEVSVRMKLDRQYTANDTDRLKTEIRNHIKTDSPIKSIEDVRFDAPWKSEK